MSNPQVTWQAIDILQQALDQLPKEPPEGGNPILWQKQREGMESKLAEMKEELNGPSAETLFFEEFWQGLEMPEAQEGASPEDQWIAHRCKQVAHYAWVKGIEYQAAQQVESEDEQSDDFEPIQMPGLIQIVERDMPVPEGFQHKPEVPEEGDS